MAPGVAPPILVTGAPRSGTSLTTEVLRACGAWVGDVNRLCENTAVRERVTKQPFRDAGLDPLAQSSFGDVEPDPAWVRREVVGILRDQRYPGGPWAYKDAKLVFQWRAWQQAFPSALWVAVWRDPEDVAASHRRWGLHLRSGGDADRVVKEHQARLADIPALHVWPDRLVRGDTSEMEDVVEALGLGWDREAVRDVVEPERWSTLERERAHVG